MKRILITGATGSIGKPIIDNIDYTRNIEVYAGVRNPENNFTDKPVKNVFFDFEDIEKCTEALEGIDYFFLLRPPHITHVTKYFKPLIDACVIKKVKHIIFLSVQNVESSSLIPHHKIEKLIKNSGLFYTFLRPGYFMQNLMGPLKYDIVNFKRIYIPAGNAKFNWIDAEDIGIAAARILEKPASHQNKVYTLTGSENLSFKVVADQMSEVLNVKIGYTSPGVIRFYLNQKSRGLKSLYIFILTMLHILPRFIDEPKIHYDLQLLTGEEPKKLQEFIFKYRNEWRR